MRLKKIKLLSDYKLFKQDQEFVFGDDSTLGIVGINGSGKSILLELISKMFVDASNQITQGNFSSDISYEAIYSLQKDHMIESVLIGIGGEWETTDHVLIKLENKFQKFKMIISNGNNEFEIENINMHYVFFPRKIVVYSSGHNEGVSDEIINYKFYSLAEKYSQKFKRNNYGEVINKGILDRYNELFYYFDDTISKLAILTSFIFESGNQAILSEFFEKALVTSFKIRLDKKDIYDEDIYFDEKASYLLNEIMSYANTVHVNENGFEYYEFHAPDNRDREQMSLLAFFEGLQRLYDYNIYKIKKRTRNRIIYGNEKNKKSLVDWNIANNRVFELLEMTFKTEKGSELELRNFSDGEYQVLQLISILNIFYGSNILFLLDEPETHFNPSWKSLFVSKVKSMLNPMSQVVFSSHNPEVITDLRKASVVSMKRGLQNGLQIETFGANPNMISANLFDKRNTVAELAKKEINIFRNKINQATSHQELEELKGEIEYTLGDSSERLMLMIEIQKRMM
ncbi:ABC transporter family protein [Natranaerovirga hydrolytica]|uniref:ABC transporter family protein n=1 Tax=Natranaerovirga hydrolytica TaxID=680378 RepID=A0A4R1MKJ3_9FIRM|nr:AAA family ATPase [Natranaerovirga hydrolytica]TCK92560.1 ABC transporter family protein [Natranaerovirga hydrolytica]